MNTYITTKGKKKYTPYRYKLIFEITEHEPLCVFLTKDISYNVDIQKTKDTKGRCGAKRIAYVTLEKQDILVLVRTFKIIFFQNPYISHTYM